MRELGDAISSLFRAAIALAIAGVLLASVIAFCAGYAYHSYANENQQKKDTRSIDQRVHDLAVELGEQRRKNEALHGEDQ